MEKLNDPRREIRRRKLRTLGSLCIGIGLSMCIGYVGWFAVLRVVAAVGK